MTEPLTLAHRCCAACGGPLVRKPKDSRRRFAAKRWCNVACRHAGPATLERRCAGCDAPLVRYPAENPSKFVKRRSCLAPQCKRVTAEIGAQKARDAKTVKPPAPCSVCGKPTVGRRTCHVCAGKKVTAKPTQPAPAVQLAPTWTVYHTGVALPEHDPLAAELRRMVEAGIAVTTIRRGQGGELEYLCKARAA